MIESLVVTLFPFLFLVVLFGGGALFRRGNVDQDGEAPIDKTLFSRASTQFSFCGWPWFCTVGALASPSFKCQGY